MIIKMITDIRQPQPQPESEKHFPKMAFKITPATQTPIIVQIIIYFLIYICKDKGISVIMD